MTVFARFCKESNLVINTKKREVMLINCSGSIYVNKVPLPQCKVFKYLGVEIKSDARSPIHILRNRLAAANLAFYRIRNNAQLLCLHNCRVRLQLITALVVSVLLYGSPLFACLSEKGMTLTPTSLVFREAEVFMRKLIRWATSAEGDIRGSFLHVLGNCESVQLLTHKQCWRFFHGLANHPRAATEFITTIQENRTIPPEHWG